MVIVIGKRTGLRFHRSLGRRDLMMDVPELLAAASAYQP